MRKAPSEEIHARWFSTRLKAESESPKEATNECAEDKGTANEALGENVPRGGQQPSGRRGASALRQQSVPVERVHFRISEEFLPHQLEATIPHGPSIGACCLLTCHPRIYKNRCPLHQVCGKCVEEWVFAWHFNNVRLTLLRVNAVIVLVIRRVSLDCAYARIGVVDYNREADRWPRTFLSGEIPKVEFSSSLLFILRFIHHCTLFGNSNQMFFRNLCEWGTSYWRRQYCRWTTLLINALIGC